MVGFFLVALLLFSVALYGAGYYLWSVPQQEAAEELGNRLRGVRTSMRSRSSKAPELLRREHRGSFAFLGDLVTWVGMLRRLQVMIEQANLKYRAADVFGLSLVLAVLTFLVLSLFGGLIFLRALLALAAGFAPVLYIMRVRAKRLKKFEEQLPDAIDLFTRTMRAGHNIHSGLETIATETADPVRMEFKKLMEELALGSQVEPALHGLGGRVPLIDLKFFITSLILQRQTGANMVSVLENLSTLVRERLNMAAKLKAHTAQQRFSAGLLCALPFVVGLGFWILKPEYIRLLWTDPVGSKFFTYAICSEIVGILVIRKIANIKV
ncbi:MAG TPA: type II secretion system F family protein [Candidatus Acidoferrales bacterium]|nr:type II secretion system F family protein [Candidatus Acidoferrales bacterium]